MTATLTSPRLRTASFAPPPVFPPRRLTLPMPDDDDAARDAERCARFEELQRLLADGECSTGCDASDAPFGGPW